MKLVEGRGWQVLLRQQLPRKQTADDEQHDGGHADHVEQLLPVFRLGDSVETLPPGLP